MDRKSFEILETKAAGEHGEFTALVSVFNNVDLVGDRVKPGAFTKTLKRWVQSGNPIPVILSHNWDDPMAHIGVADPSDVKESARGLEVKGTLDVDDNEVAAQVFKLLKRRSLTGFSFGYTVERSEIDENGVNDLLEVDLVEVGPTLKGANPEAQLQEVKSVEKAVWSTAYINDLPDSAFLYIEPGGERDGEGKTTPRSLRHFPYKDAEGNVDLPHLRNALSRIPQSNLPDAVKERLQARARRILDGMNETSSEDPDEKQATNVHDVDDEPPAKSPPDPLRKRTEELALEVALGRSPQHVPPEAQPDPEPEPEPEPELPPERELRRQTNRAALEMALGGSIDDAQ